MPANVLGASALVTLPAVIFYGILFRTAMDLPLEDDYEALLGFLNQLTVLEGFSARFLYFLTAMFNEYKLFFGHAVAWLQLAIFQHANIRVLCEIGNGFVFLIAVLLWKLFLPGHKNLAQRIALFAPASFLLFQLQYVETLNWAMPSLATLPVLAFSLAAIYLLAQPSRRRFLGALICLVLAVSSFGNGLLMIPVGFFILAVRRRFLAATAWLLVSAGCVIAYTYRYSVSATHGEKHDLGLWSRPLCALAFIGNTAAIPFGRINHRLTVTLCIGLGLLVLSFFVFMARRGYIAKNPTVCFCVLFLLLTAFGVAGFRSELGIAHSLDSRYQIYSALLLILAWFAIAEEFLQHVRGSLWRNRVFLCTVAAAALFSLSMDAWGWLYLEKRNHKMIAGMMAYQHSGAGPILPFPNQGARFDELDKHATIILKQSVKLGIYQPPTF